jgi:hypothetical protein
VLGGIYTYSFNPLGCQYVDHQQHVRSFRDPRRSFASHGEEVHQEEEEVRQAAKVASAQNEVTETQTAVRAEKQQLRFGQQHRQNDPSFGESENAGGEIQKEQQRISSYQFRSQRSARVDVKHIFCLHRVSDRAPSVLTRTQSAHTVRIQHQPDKPIQTFTVTATVYILPEEENNIGFSFVGGPYPNTNVYKDTHKKTSIARVLAT